jgi:hypothetical protein
LLIGLMYNDKIILFSNCWCICKARKLLGTAFWGGKNLSNIGYRMEGYSLIPWSPLKHGAGESESEPIMLQYPILQEGQHDMQLLSAWTSHRLPGTLVILLLEHALQEIVTNTSTAVIIQPLQYAKCGIISFLLPTTISGSQILIIVIFSDHNFANVRLSQCRLQGQTASKY